MTGLIQPTTPDDMPASTQALAATAASPGGEAIIDVIEIVFMESFPLQVFAVIKGNLPDGCTVISDYKTEHDGNNFQIHLNTQRPDDAVCTLALIPFEETISLDVYGLPAGTYTVTADETKAEFTFSQDNTESVGG